MNGQIKQRLGELLHTEMYRLLQLLYSTLSCIQERNEHDKQRSVEFYMFKILKNDQFIIIIIIIALDYAPYKMLHKLKSACSIRKNQL